MRSFKEFIIEKLKVSKNIKVGPTLRDFIDFYMRNSNWKWADLHNIMFGYDMWGKDKEFKNWEEFKDFLEYNIDKHITVELNRTDSKSIGWDSSTNQLINQYTFEVDNVPFVINVNKYARKDTFEDWFKSHHPDEVYEKLKVSTKSGEVVRIELRNFVTWYMYDDAEWDESDLKSVEFARNTTESYFGGSYKKMYEFVCKHEQDIIDVREYADTYGNYYAYEFTVEDIPFKVEAYIEKPSDLLSKQWRILVEKLKLSAPKIINCTVRQLFKNEFDRKFNYNDLVGFFTDVRKEHFDDNVYDLIDFLKEHANDKIEVTQEIEDIIPDFGKVVRYSFTIAGIEFTDIIVVEYVNEKLKVSSSNTKVINCTLRQLFKNEFNRNINNLKYNDFLEFFKDVRKEHFNDDIYELIVFLKEHANDKIEVTQEVEDTFEDFGELVKYSFNIAGIEFIDYIVFEYVSEKLKVSSNVKPETINCTVKQFMDWFWRDKDSKYTGEDLELFQFGGDAIDQISPFKKDYDKMYVFLKWREDEDIEVEEQIESGRSHKLDTDWQYGIYTFTLGTVSFDVTAPFSSDEDPFSVYYEKLMEIEL